MGGRWEELDIWERRLSVERGNHCLSGRIGLSSCCSRSAPLDSVEIVMLATSSYSSTTTVESLPVISVIEPTPAKLVPKLQGYGHLVAKPTPTRTRQAQSHRLLYKGSLTLSDSHTDVPLEGQHSSRVDIADYSISDRLCNRHLLRGASPSNVPDIVPKLSSAPCPRIYAWSSVSSDNLNHPSRVGGWETRRRVRRSTLLASRRVSSI